jgi:hypothetical protein
LINSRRKAVLWSNLPGQRWIWKFEQPRLAAMHNLKLKLEGEDHE